MRVKNPRGQEHHRAKLPDEKVREMRSIWHRWEQAGSDKGYGTIAALFGISQWTARDIVTYRTRKSA